MARLRQRLAKRSCSAAMRAEVENGHVWAVPLNAAEVCVAVEACMHKRLCFLLPDVRSANLVIEKLRKAGISDQHLMIVAKEDTLIDDPPTNIDKTDFYPGLERGLAVGGVLGAIAGLVVLRLTPLGLVLGGAAIPLLTMIGAGVSGFMTALAGASFPNSRLAQFEDAVKRGEILIVVDVPDAEVGRIEELVRETHAEAEFVGVEPHAPVIPPSPSNPESKES